MSFWSNLQAAKAADASRYLEALAYTIEGAPLSDPDPSLYANQAQLMQRLSWVHSAIGRAAESTASLAEFEVFQLEGADRTQIDNHPFEDLLLHPNPYQFRSRFEFIEATVGYLKLSGNCYIWANALSPETPPGELWLLRPDRVRAVPDSQKFVRGYVYTIQGRSVPFEADEIVHLKMFHPLNDHYGLSAIESISIASELDFKQSSMRATSSTRTTPSRPAP